MKISDFLSSDHVTVDVRAADKRQLLRALARKAASTVNLSEYLLCTELLKREGLGTTGMGNGVAIPHARFQGVAQPLGLLARLKQPVDFEAIDGRPVDLVFLLILPAASESGQLGALALVARKLRAAESLVRLRSAKNAAELYQAIAD